MVSPELIHALTAARRRLAKTAWQQLAATLAANNASPDAASIRTATAGLLSPDAAWILSEAFQKCNSTKWCEIAAAMTAVDCLAGDKPPRTEIIWTGPAHNRFPVRRTDQVLYDLVSNAKKPILLVTFAAHHVRHLCAHLCRGRSLVFAPEDPGRHGGRSQTREVVEVGTKHPRGIQYARTPQSKTTRNPTQTQRRPPLGLRRKQPPRIRQMGFSRLP